MAIAPGTLFSWTLTQFTVFFAWIFFRLPNPQDYTLAINRLFNQIADIQFHQKIYIETLQMERLHLTLLLVLLMVIMGCAYTIKRSLKLQLNWHLQGLFGANFSVPCLDAIPGKQLAIYLL